MGPDEIAAIELMPAALRELIQAELAAGNTVVEVGHSFPAPPAGCYVKLARPLLSRARASWEDIDFHDRNSSLWSGEYADPKRLFFVLEPPRPEPAEPDMDAIRAAANTSSGREPQLAAENSVVERFRRSMTMNWEKHHDGVGHDIDILRQADPAEREAIERLLLSRGVLDWMDVEALAALDSPGARDALLEAARSGDQRIRMAVLQYAPDLLATQDRTAALVSDLETAEFYGGLTQALAEAEEFHPPAVMDALFRGALQRDGESAVHFAALLTFLHGKAEEPFDWEQRPLFLEFHTADQLERRQVFRRLCARLEVDADELLSRLKA
jgi:hypothetical protein